MKNFHSPGHLWKLAAPSDVTSGQGIQVGQRFGVVQNDALTGEDVVLALEGHFRLPKAAPQTWSTLGALVYWDAGNDELTTTASGSLLVGTVAEAAASADTEGVVRVDGVARADEA